MGSDEPNEVTEEQLSRIEAGLEHPPKPDFLGDAEWNDIIASRDPSIIRMAGGLQADMYRQGVEGADMAQGAPVLILTTKGRRSGNEISTCLNHVALGEDLLVVGSFAALGRSPFWVLNLEAEPCCRVELGDESWSTVARPGDSGGRARLWPGMVERVPRWGHFQKYCRREFPVFALRRDIPSHT